MRKAILTLTAALAFFSASAQTFSYSVLSPDDGFPSTVNSIFVEKEGFAWLGAQDALYLLYGNNSFSRHDTSQGYLPGNIILQIRTDSHGCAWILTNRGFIGYNSRLNIEHHSFVVGLDGSQVAYSVLPQDDDIYFGGAGCIWKYSHSTAEFSTVCTFDTPDTFRITDLVPGSHNGRLTLTAFSKGKKEYFRFDASTGERIDADGVLESGFCAGFTDSRGYIWMSLFDVGVFRMTPEFNVVERYDRHNSSLSEDNVLCFAERNGKIWMGTDGGGINILDPWDDRIEQLHLARKDKASDPLSCVLTMFCDHNGHIWCGRPTGGIVIVSESQIEMFRTEDFDPAIDAKGITYFLQDGQSDDIWVGTFGSGLMKYSPRTGQFTRYPSTDGLYIYSMAKVDDNTIGLSCPNRGFFNFYKDTGKVEKFEPLSEFKYYFATQSDGVFLDTDVHENILLFSSDIKRWDLGTKSLEIFTPDINPDDGYLHPVRGTMCQYILDYTHIYKWNESLPDKLETVYELTDGSRFYCSSIDHNGVIWFGAGLRVGRFDTETREVTFLDHIFDIHPSLLLCADNGKIWLGNRNALYVYNPKNNAIMTLGEADGVRDNEYVLQAKLQASDGDIYLGGSKGMVRVLADYAVPSSADPEIVVSGVTVDGEEIFDFGDLKVNYDHSNINIRFLVRGPDILKTNMYRIQGAGPKGFVMNEEYDKPFISFRRLDPGRYTLSVATTTQDGRWTEPCQIYDFTVTPPWHKTWWAVLIMCLIAATAALLLIKAISRRRTEARVKESGEERYNFLINVSHELRTPLTLILGPLKRILADPELKDQHKSSIKKVCQQADRMATLLNTVLTTNKIQNGATEVHPRPVPVNDWLMRCADEFSDEATGRDMSIVNKTDPQAGCVMMDPDLCRIVFSNIMSNALRHNNPGHPITVWSSATISPGYVRIGIRDHGTGIGSVDVSKLFERYYRETEDRTGFGIGLSYAKTIIDAHDGRIGAFNNDKDPGATFWFELPAAGQPETDDGDTPEYVSKLTRSIMAKALKDKTVLFVDDNADLRDYVREEMTGICGKLLLAYNGADALRVLVDHEVDAVVADVMMPEIDGITLCDKIKSSPNYRHIPVVLLSARADDESKSRGYKAKADYYLSKPFDIKELVAILEGKTRK